MLDWRRPTSKQQNGRENLHRCLRARGGGQPCELYLYIADKASPAVAKRYTDAIIGSCESLATFPHRGTRRDDVRPGLRITNHRRRAVIAFEVNDETTTVSILGIFYGGRDYEAELGDPDLTDNEPFNLHRSARAEATG